MRPLHEFLVSHAQAQGHVAPKDLHKACVDRGLNVTYNAVYQWWTGMSRPSPEHATALAEVLAIPLNERHALFALPVVNRPNRPAA